MEHETRSVFAGVQLTTPFKVLYQEKEITKADLAGYYEMVADRMLPLVNDRPISMVRCPGGRSGQSFYEKHAKNFPEAMKHIDVLEKGGHKKPFAYLNGLASIIAGVQMSTLEFHIWGSRISDLDKPDRIVFDIDPGEDVTFDEVKDAAFEIRDRLKKSPGLLTVPLLTGGKGIHVIAPITPRANWDDVLEFSHELARKMEKANPGKYISISGKNRRKGLMFIDYLRNSRGATAVAPYSTRNNKGAPVATPVSWEELKTVDAANCFNIENMRTRIKEEDPWEESYTWKQQL